MFTDKSPTGSALLEEVQRFLQSAVHDLRSAHRRTSIASELLLQTSNEQDRQELNAQLAEGLAKTEELLAGISNYATVLTPERYNLSNFPAARAVRFAVANLDRKIRETGAVINVGDLPDITADRDRLAGVFEHLLANSLKFRTSETLIIEITASKIPEGWRFDVKDNGIGIPEKYQDRLFTPFRRLQGADVPGAGLGLAICRIVIESHGGRIWIEPSEAPGVTLSFNLPSSDGD